MKRREIGDSGKFAYYPLSPASMKAIMKGLRTVSLTFDAHATGTRQINGLEPYMEFPFLVKSSSRFFLKPDIGEVLDAIPYEEMFATKPDFDAIWVHDGYETLPDTEGEHFQMTATLLKQTGVSKAQKAKAIKQLHQLV